MIDKKFVNVLWIGIRNIEFCSRTIGDAYFPQCRPISRRFIYKITHFNIRTCITSCWSYIYFMVQLKNLNIHRSNTWGYGHDNIISVISYKTRDPCIEVIVTSTDIVDGKIALLICSRPELIILIEGEQRYSVRMSLIMSSMKPDFVETYI